MGTGGHSSGTRARSLTVTDVVRHGSGRSSRFDLTVGNGERTARLRGIPAKEVLTYSRIEKLAIGYGVLLPHYDRGRNGVWRDALAPAIEQARVEPSLEGEEIAEAIAEEIRALVALGERGESLSDLASGKVVERDGNLLVSPEALTQKLRQRLRDDVLPKASIAETAMAELGMVRMRPRFLEGRPHAWAFPCVVLESIEEVETPERVDPPDRSVDGRTHTISLENGVGSELDPLDQQKPTQWIRTEANGRHLETVELPEPVTSGSKRR